MFNYSVNNFYLDNTKTIVRASLKTETKKPSG